MKRFQLADYSANLDKPALAGAIRGELETALKETDQVRLDFTGVLTATAEFAEEFLGPVFNAHGAAAVGAMLDLGSMKAEVRQAFLLGLKAAREKAQDAPPPRVTPPTQPPPPPPPFVPPEPPAQEALSEAEEASAGQFTPTRLAEELEKQLRGYIEAAYPLKDPVLVESRTAILRPNSDVRVISQEPFVETTPRYQSGPAYADLDLPSGLGDFFTELSDPTRYVREDSEPGKPNPLLFNPPYKHQGDALVDALQNGRDLIVATGTGSGKTECFLLPILGKLFLEANNRPQSFARRSVRALVLYPMNALVNDQLARLRLLFGNEAFADRINGIGGRRIQFGMYTSRTPYPGPRDWDNKKKDQHIVKPLIERYTRGWQALEPELRRRGKWPAKDLTRFLGTRGPWRNRLRTAPEDRELLTRHEMHATPPDVLVTNYSMLEYMLMRPIERPIFTETRRWLEADDANQLLLVLDEAHMYRGARGAEVGQLIRRLRARLGIQGREDKLQVICTSASLGTDEEAQAQIRRFAADLTGKSPPDFELVRGARALPEVPGPGSLGFATALAQVELADLHEALLDPSRDLADTLSGVLEHLGIPSGPDLEARLYESLRETNAYKVILRETAGHAVALGELAERVFPGSEEARPATEVLLTLGTIARPEPSSPGLIPTRVHLFYRGLPGLYACLNRFCEGRQSAPGQEAAAGKLFIEPRVHCDACESRVFELASCRDCGGAYFLAYVADVDSPEFLWGEESEPYLQPIQLLAEEPNRDDGRWDEVDVALLSGYVEPDGDVPVRTLWVACDRNRARQAEFLSCPICQGTTKRSSPIRDLRTKGEKPFTVLVETQFAQQPAQKATSRHFPNGGRKVLVFSDGRQKAARLAPALERAHLRDTFRQLICLASRRIVEELARPCELRHLYPAFLKVVSERNLALTEDLASDEALDADLRSAEGVPLDELVEEHPEPAMAYSRLLYQELCDRHYSLVPLGLGSLIESRAAWRRLSSELPPELGDEPSCQALLRVWIRMMVERNCFLPSGANPFRLGEAQYDNPEGIDPQDDRKWVPPKFRAYLSALDYDETAEEAFATWIKRQAPASALVQRRENLYYLTDRRLTLEVSNDGWHVCDGCSRLHRHFAQEMCPDCAGALEPLEEVSPAVMARQRYYRQQVEKALHGDGLEPFGLFAAEHSAQLSVADSSEAIAKTEEYELRFQDLRTDFEQREPVVDVLSCTTTMEVGIDIGALTSVALRNVPPHVANYQQRAGRAGRRGKAVASVITYALGGSHDAYFFDQPHLIISGAVRPPVVYVENQVIALRHARAFVVQTFFHEQVEGSQSGSLFATLGTVREFLEGGECSLESLRAWLTPATRQNLQEEMLSWLPRHGYWRDVEIPESARQETARAATDDLIATLEQHLPIDQFSRQGELEEQAERDQLELVLQQDLLQTLIEQAVLPRYAFPTDVVAFHVFRPRSARGRQPEFLYQPQRDLQIALSEYAPGRELTIDKQRYRVSAVYSPYVAAPQACLREQRRYSSCTGAPGDPEGCGFVQDTPGQPLSECPICGGQIRTMAYATPPGFAPDINVRPQRDRGGSISVIGRTTRAKLEVPLSAAEDVNWDTNLPRFAGRIRTLHRAGHLVMVNKGLGERGFLMCRACGYAEPVEGRGFTRGQLAAGGPQSRRAEGHPHPIRGGRCTGSVSDPFYMGHRFYTDLLIFRLVLGDPVTCNTRHPAGRSALTTLAETFVLAASRLLQIDEGEIAGNWSPVTGMLGQEVDIYLYDVLPGGAGFARQVQENLSDMLGLAEGILAPNACSCERSCYHCLRVYANQTLHPLLDRHLGRDLLAHAMHGTVPTMSDEAQTELLRSLGHVAELHGFQPTSGHAVDGGVVPLRLEGEHDEVWVGAYHPLIDAEEVEFPLTELAGLTEITKIVNGYDARNRLPRAYQEVEGLLR